MVYVIEVLVPGESETRIMEVPAPSFHTAAMMLAAWRPGIWLKKLHRSYPEVAKGLTDEADAG